MTEMDEYQDINELLKPCRRIVASDKLRQRVSELAANEQRLATKRQLLWGGASAAACMAIVLGCISLLNTNSKDTDCIVYAEGKMLVGEAAQTIAEADIAEMENFMQTIEAQRAAEEAKVQQFMNHQNTQNR
jgi:hypothetical protein